MMRWVDGTTYEFVVQGTNYNGNEDGARKTQGTEK